MQYSDIKKIKQFCDNLHSQPDWREVVEEIENGSDDFEIDDVRFIESNSIDAILEDELSSDPYILGCFASWAIADATGWPIELIDIAQKNDAFEDIGKALTGEHISDLASILVQYDGYGHHFNRYDGSEEELILNGRTYLVFDNH